MGEHEKLDIVKVVTFRLFESEIEKLDEIGRRKYRLDGKGDRNKTLKLMIEDMEGEE